MCANSFGRLFVVTTYGESHGESIGAIVDGMVPGFPLSCEDIQCELDRRRPGASVYVSQRREPDQVKILSGVFEGLTTGAPIGLQIINQDVRSSDYKAHQTSFRPGHADYTYFHKYGHRDWKGGGRASARECAMRVASGAIAKKYLQMTYGVKVRAYLKQIGPHVLDFKDWDQVRKNPFCCPNDHQLDLLEHYLKGVRKSGESVGAQIEVEASPMPVGVGEPLFDKLDARVAYALMGIPAVKAVEIGDGLGVVNSHGSEQRDPIMPNGFISNHAGGILGGISTGQPLIARASFKPTSSIPQPIDSVDEQGQPVQVAVKGRHDPCVALRAVPIVEAMVSLVIMDQVLMHQARMQRGQ